MRTVGRGRAKFLGSRDCWVQRTRRKEPSEIPRAACLPFVVLASPQHELARLVWRRGPGAADTTELQPVGIAR
jgi:hypothetical protein